MDGSRDCHTEWSNSGTERQISYDITYMWNQKLKTVNVTEMKQAYRYREQTSGYQ